MNKNLSLSIIKSQPLGPNKYLSQSMVRTRPSPLQDDDVSKSMLVQMQKQNNNLSEQLVTQKSQYIKEEIISKLQLEKLRSQCEIYAQDIETQQIKKEDLQDLIATYQKNLQVETSYKYDEIGKTNSIHKHLDQKFQYLKQNLNVQESQIQNSKQDLNLARRERVIHSTVIKGMESDIKQKSIAYMKLIKKREISDVQLKVYKEQFKKLTKIIILEDSVFLIDQKSAIYDNQDQLQSQDYLLSNTNGNDQARSSSLILSPGKFDNSMLSQNDSERIYKSQQEEEELVFLQEALQKIFYQTSVKSVDQLIKLYGSIEDQNENLYQEVTETTVKIEEKQKEIDELDKQVARYRQKVHSVNSSPIKSANRQDMSPLKKCDQMLAKCTNELQEMKENLILIAQKIDLPDLTEKESEVSEWNLDVFADEVDQRCRQILMVSDMLDLSERVKSEKKRDILTKRQRSDASQDTFVIAAGQRKDKKPEINLDEILHTSIHNKQIIAEKIKASETIFNHNDFHSLGQNELNKQQNRRKLSKKTTIIQK